MPADHLLAANQVKQLYSRYEQSKDLISVGAYTSGIDPITDLAIARQPQIQAYLSQGLNQPINLPDSLSRLLTILEPVDAVDDPSVSAGRVEADVVEAPRRGGIALGNR